MRYANMKKGDIVIGFDEFKRMEIRVAEIKEVKEHPNADKLYILTIDLGGKMRQLVAGIREHYQPDELLGKQIVVVVNLEPATIRGVESEGMLLAAQDESGISVLTVDKAVALGSLVK